MATHYTGAAMLLKNGTIAAGTAVASFVANSFSIDNQVIDVSSKDLGWRKLLAGGLKSVSISGSGIVSDDSAFETFQGYAMAVPAAANTHSIVFADSDGLEGSFIITKFAIEGSNNDKQTFSFTAESAGAVTFTQA